MQSKTACFDLKDSDLSELGSFIIFSLDVPCRVIGEAATRKPVTLFVKVYQGPEVNVEARP